MRRRILTVFVLLVVASCSGSRYRIIEGPATLVIGATPFTPGVTVEIKDGGRAFFGPRLPKDLRALSAPEGAEE